MYARYNSVSSKTTNTMKTIISFIIIIIISIWFSKQFNKPQVIYIAKEKAEVIKVDLGCAPSMNVKLNKLLVKYFKNCKDIKIIWAIAQAESFGKTIAINKANKNGSWDCGYVQANTIHKKNGENFESFCKRQFNLEENIATASQVYKEAGNKFTPWVTYNNLAYLQHFK